MKTSNGEDRPQQEAYLNIELESAEASTSDDIVLASSMSEKRLEDFRAGYLKDRQQSSALETVFGRADALEEEADWSDEHRIGLNVLVRKGPFVEGASWAPYQTWRFALALERHLLSRFEKLLRSSSDSQPGPGIHWGWPEILSSSDRMFETIRSGPNHQTALVIAGPLNADWLEGLTRQSVPVTPDFDLPDGLNRTWIVGLYHDRLILRIAEASTAALYAVDVHRFARLTRFGLPQLEIDDFSEEHARELVGKKRVRPSVRQGRPATGRELIRQLRLKVWLKLLESWDLRMLDPDAVASASILD